jgi:hypothetical protein
MDTLWLLSQQADEVGAIGSIVSILEDSNEFGSYGQDLYAHLLPTLGERAVPILLERLRSISAQQSGDYRVQLIGNAFVELARQERTQLDETMRTLLQSNSEDCQNVAIAAVPIAPRACFLDRLWDIHQSRLGAMTGDQSNSAPYSDYKACFAAMRACIALEPGWLRERILSADPEREDVSDLGYLLVGLDHPKAQAIWSDTRATLLVD